MVQAAPRKMPVAPGPGRVVCGLGVLPSGRWADQGHTTLTKDILIGSLWSEDEPAGRPLCSEGELGPAW